MLRFFLLLICLGQFAYGQELSQPQAAPEGFSPDELHHVSTKTSGDTVPSIDEARKFIARIRGGTATNYKNLRECEIAADAMYAAGVEQQTKMQNAQNELIQWREWGRYSNSLKSENEDLRKRVIALSIGGFLLGLLTSTLLLFARWSWKWVHMPAPIPSGKKQLIVLLCIALWISGAVLLKPTAVVRHPINALVEILIYSLPALAFGSSLFWWFGRKQELLHLE